LLSWLLTTLRGGEERCRPFLPVLPDHACCIFTKNGVPEREGNVPVNNELPEKVGLVNDG